MVVAQLVERFLLTAEVCGSNPVMGKIYVQFLKEAGYGPF